MSSFYTNVLTHKGKIYIRGIDENKEPFREVIKYKPYLFIKANDGNAEYKTIHGEPMKKKEFDSISQARKYISDFSDVDGMKIYGLQNFEYLYLNEVWENEVQYDPTLISIVSLDIETKMGNTDMATAVREAPNEITAITLSKNGKYFVLGCKDYVKHRPDVYYLKCKNEVDLLEKFIKVWKELAPDVITGWNIEFFDIPYIVNRIRNLFGESLAKELSPWGLISAYTIEVKGQKIDSYTLEGISNLDYMALYKKFTYTKQESYKLDYIALVELGESKLDYAEFKDLDDLYERDYQKYIEYNIHDTYLIVKLEEKLKLIELVFAMAYDAKVNYKDTLTTVRQWDVIIHNYLLKQKVVIPPVSVSSGSELVGGYVKEPHLGLHNWVVSFDLNSLYPHLIQQYNISPDSYVTRIPVPTVDEILQGKEVEDNGYSVAANGCCFRKDKHGFLAELMERMYEDRKIFKNYMLAAKATYEETKDPELKKDIAKWDNMQQAKKIQLNSAYGALGNKYFRWFDIRFAEAITLSGQLSIKWVSRDLNKYLNKLLKTNNIDYVIANDTDSCYITLDRLVKLTMPNETDNIKITRFLDRVCEEKLQKVIDDSYQALADHMHAFAQRMFMKRECIANKAIWVAKKRYILNVYNQEGVAYNEPVLKVSGIEAVRSSTPQVCREKIKEALKIVMNKSEADLQEFIKKFKEEFSTLSFEQVAFPRGITAVREYADSNGNPIKGTPIHVKGSLLYNRLIDQYDLQGPYEKIGDGDSIRFFYLKQPNQLSSNVIAAPNELPKEFKLEPFLDYDMQFQKSFLDPLAIILNSIGWSTEKKSTLEAFFA